MLEREKRALYLNEPVVSEHVFIVFMKPAKKHIK